MNLKIYKINDRYAFSVDKFSSFLHYFLCPDIKSSYPNFRSAYSAATKMMNKGYHMEVMKRHAAEEQTPPFVADLSAEQMLNQHYAELLVLMEERSRSKFKTSKERELVFQEIKQAVDELEKIVEHIDKKGETEKLIAKFQKLISSKFPDLEAKAKKKEKEESELVPSENTDPMTAPIPDAAGMPPVAASSIWNVRPEKGMASEVMEHYGENSCKAIEHNHPNAFFKVQGNTISICEPKDKEVNVLLKIAVNENMNIDGIYPQNELSQIYPVYSTKFYQRYWKPIVEANGHFFVDDASLLLVSSKCCLPDIPSKAPLSVNLTGWHVHKKQELPVKLSFRGDNMIWFFERCEKLTKEAKVSRYREEDFIRNAPVRVQCIDPLLKSIYNKYGEVVQVIPLDEGLELDIDFGRHVVRLTEEQIQIVQ